MILRLHVAAPLLALALAAAACASPVDGLWPPAPGEPSHRIVVSVDSWHSVIALWPEEDPEGADPSAAREWAYAERGYYHEGDAGCSGSMRALFLPSEGTVVVRSDGRTLPEWSFDPPVLSWEFRLTEAGRRALVAHLEAEKGATEPFDESRGFLWYPAARSYHGFHHCHHFTARALRAAGLPVFASWALFRWSLVAELDRAARIAAESAAPPAQDLAD